MPADDQKPATKTAGTTVGGAMATPVNGSDASESIAAKQRSEKLLKASELYNRGSRSYLVKSYAEAADEFSQVCTMYEELYGELSNELGMPYLLYAKSLIALSLEENKVLEVSDEDQDDDEDDDDDADADEEVEGGDDDEEEAEVEEKNENKNADDDDADDNNDNDGATTVVKGKDAPIKGEAVAKATPTKANDVTAGIENKKKTAPEGEVDSTGDDSKKDHISAATTTTTATTATTTATSAEKTDETMVTSTRDDGSGDNKQKQKQKQNGAVEREKPSTSNVIAIDEAEEATEEGTTGASAADDQETQASNLQVAWEILELAAKIFARQGLSGLPNLAEVQTELANIEFENNVMDAAREDYEKALKIYDELATPCSRMKAEIHYKIGLTYLMQQMNQEAADCLKKACTLVDTEIDVVKAKKQPTDKEKSNILDMEETKQEIWAKIGEIEECQSQQMSDIRVTLKKLLHPAFGDGGTNGEASSSSASTSTSSSAVSTSTAKPTDISHLIKRKQPVEAKSSSGISSEAEAALDPPPAKRPTT